MVPTVPQWEPVVAGDMEEFGDPTKFHNWAGRRAAHLILPFIDEHSKVGVLKTQSLLKSLDTLFFMMEKKGKEFREDCQVQNASLAIQVNQITYDFFSLTICPFS